MIYRMLKKVLPSLFAFASLCPVSLSWAAGNGVDCAYTGTYYIFLPPMTFNLGRDIAIGDLVGSWITTSASPTWTCYRKDTGYGVIHLGVAGYGPYAKRGEMTVEGQNFSIYPTVKAGLGYIVRWRTSYKGQTSNWQALSSASGVWVPPDTLFGPIEYEGQNKFDLNSEIQIHLVKTGNNLTAGSVAAFDPIYIQPYRSLFGGSQIEQGPYRIVDYRGNDLKITSGGTCTTPDVSVQFPPITINDFNGVGSTAGLTSFQLSFNNCPAGLNSIGYSFAATTSVIDATNGVVAIDSSSTAQGVGIQVLTEDDDPIQYGTVYPLKNYDPLNTKSYVVQHQAALYQTGSKVSPGKIKGAITFTMSYK